MAIPIAFLLGYYLSSKKDEIKVKEINTIDLSTITEIFSKSYNSIDVHVENVNNVSIRIRSGCIVSGGININQRYTGKLKVYASNSNSLDSSAIDKLQTEITNQMELSLNKLNTDYAALFDGFTKGTEINGEIKNELDRSIRTSVTAETISDIVARSYNKNTITIDCDAPISDGFKLDQFAQQNIIISSLIDTALKSIVENETIIDWTNDVTADLTIKNIGPLTIIMIIIGIVAIVIAISIIARVSFKKKESYSQTSL